MEEKKKILIIEDEKPLAKALELKLGEAGFETEAVYDGEEAAKILKTKKFDLIILDLIIPKLDGFDVLEMLRIQKIDTPVVISSNLSQEEDLNKAKQMGVVDYFIKSNTSIADVVKKISKYVK